MAPEKREQGSSLKERLFGEFYGFSFFQAVKLLEMLSSGKKPLGEALSPGEEAVRFSVKPGFAFPPSDIASLTSGDDAGPATMEVTFMGLIGPSGILPDWYNELAVERTWQKDLSLAAFLDIFHHRLLSLFYLAWKKHQLPAHYRPGATDRHSRHLLSFIGLGTHGLADAIGLPEESLIFYSGLLSQQIPAAVAIEATAEYFSGTKAEIHQFIDRIIALDPEDCTRLGLANGTLGANVVCGSHAWENHSKFRICLGPLGYERFVRFLPTGDMLPPIFSLLRYMVGIEFEFEVRVVLHREDVPPCVLGKETPASPRLGWSTWLKTPGIVHEEDPYVTFQGPLL